MRVVLILTVALLAACPDNPGNNYTPTPTNNGPEECVVEGDEADSDGDGAPDRCDNCPDDENADQLDSDHDGKGDVCDDDDDGDAVADDADTCPLVFQPNPDLDTDGDGIGDECDPCPTGADASDRDEDGLNDCIDLCPDTADPNNDDADGDRVGDVCDNCPDVPNTGQYDRDGDGEGDACDDDTPFGVEESTIAQVHQAIESGEVTCSDIVDESLQRIARYELDVSDGPPINAFVQLNESVREQAAALDARYEETGELVGPLHCVTFGVKTNYGTTDTDSTNGMLALWGTRNKKDSWAVQNLRDQGAILVGATAMDELARGIFAIGSAHGRSGNAYNPRRNPGGSSSGSGAMVGASFAIGGTGTDNCASLTVPAAYQGLVTMRPTYGLISTAGLYPSLAVDTVAGPMARTVRDMATMLDAMSMFNINDPRHRLAWARPPSFLDSLREDGLEGKRIGVLRRLREDTVGAYRHPFGGGDGHIHGLWQRAFEDMEAQGATIVDNVQLPKFDHKRVGSGTVIHKIEDYLANQTTGFDSPDDICESGRFSEHIYRDSEHCFTKINRARSHVSEAPKKLADALQHYEDNTDYVTSVMDRLDLDALVYPVDANGHAGITGAKANCIESSVTGMPVATVLVGFSNHDDPLPVGLMIHGRKYDEPTVLEIAYAYEQATRHRRPPRLTSAAASADDVPRLDIADYNDLHFSIAEKAWQDVLKDNGKYDLTSSVFTQIVTDILQDRGATHLLPQ